MLFTVQFSPASCHFFLDLSILRSILFSDTLNLYCVLEQISHTHTHTYVEQQVKLLFLCFYKNTWEEKYSKLNDVSIPQH